MNVFTKFSDIPAMTLQDIKKTKRFRRTEDNMKIVHPQFEGYLKKKDNFFKKKNLYYNF